MQKENQLKIFQPMYNPVSSQDLKCLMDIHFHNIFVYLDFSPDILQNCEFSDGLSDE